MVALVRDLFHHKAHADASMLMAVNRHEVASSDHELRKLFHHILVAHRFWIHLCQALRFSVETEDIVPATHLTRSSSGSKLRRRRNSPGLINSRRLT